MPEEPTASPEADLPGWAIEAIMIHVDDAVLAACETMLLNGAHSYQIDEVLVARGWKIGPYERQDHIGLGPAYARRRAHGGAHNGVQMIISNRMVEEGRLGKIVGVGWYRYPGGGGAVIDPITEDLIVEESRFANVERRDHSDNEIIKTVDDVLDSAISDIANYGLQPLETSNDPDEFIPPDLRKQLVEDGFDAVNANHSVTNRGLGVDIAMRTAIDREVIRSVVIGAYF